ncbi:serine/arginine-rich splicing factor 2 [Lucilia sericata]|uniref:serine/arginine-rich splicing factor 2 n=1 Tax=Lucilia sericata TaxID=13632 RepID=UPI0018A81154|nr:serine/arginine-rich splicing factor 2 [Lucilia sericata]XP_037811904.1 serine/arginine-rich splicing factor 2 [Lucilia sericata]
MNHNNNNSGRPPPRIDGMISLKVDNLTYRTTPEDLRRVFERCGDVGDIYIPRDRYTRESRGFAFVRFYDKRDAEEALEAMDGRKLDGRELRVQMARYGRPTSPSNNRRNNNRRGGGGRRRSRSPIRRRSRSPRRRSYSRSRSPQSRSPVRRNKFSRSPVRRSLSRSGSRNGLGAIGSSGGGGADRGRSVSRSRSRS